MPLNAIPKHSVLPQLRLGAFLFVLKAKPPSLLVLHPAGGFALQAGFCSKPAMPAAIRVLVAQLLPQQISAECPHATGKGANECG